jgi:CelD/BcsL family acetyltransferase involved in cellulose biosynthesis
VHDAERGPQDEAIVDVERTVQLRIVETMDGFRSLREEWNNLAEYGRSPLLRHEFFEACLSSGLDRSAPAIFVSTEQGRVTAIAPLERVRQGGMSRLQTIGRRLNEPCGFLFSDEEALGDLLLAIRNAGHPFLLPRLAAGHAEANGLQRIKRLGDFLNTRDGGTSPYLPLRAGLADVERRLSTGRRADLRRKRRKAETLGPVAVRVLNPSVEEVDASLDAFFQLEASGWKGRSASAVLSSPEKETFFRLYGRSLAAEGKLRVFLLSIDGVNAAARIAIQHNDSLWELKIAYNEALHHCSPGMILTYETIRYACEEHLESVEFLGRVAPWNDFWGIEKRHHSTIRYYPRSLKGLWCIGSDALMLAAKLGRRPGYGRPSEPRAEPAAPDQAGRPSPTPGRVNKEVLNQ